VKKWVFDTGFDKSNPAYGCGNHNVMVADFDNDGKQEVCMGACAIDDDGKLLWSTKLMHGDAMHVGDLDPNHEGQEVFICHEDGNYGISLVDGRNGQIIWHYDGDKDTGRCCADNIVAGNSGAEFWGSRPANAVFDVNGKQIGNKSPAMNFLIYWDGDLERELLNDITITDGAAINNYPAIFTASGCASNNSTKAVPCLTADIFGDWREELVLRTEDNSKLRIFCTNTETKYRLTTLMHDMQYRMQNCCQQSSYNQPPHVSYYLGSDAPLPARPKVLLNNTPDRTDIPVEPIVTETVTATQPVTTTQPVTAEPVVTGKPAAEIKDGEIYTFRNAGSGLYLGVEGGNAEKNANIAQSADRGQQSRFRAVSAGNGYFCLVSLLDEGTDYAMDVHAKKTEDGTNIELYPLNNGENQQFRFMANGDGSYKIAAKISGDRSCVTVSGSDGNVFEQTINGSGGQNWFAEPVAVQGSGIVYGDTNCDGTVDLADAILIMQALSNPDRFGVDGTEGLHLTVQGRINADCSGGGDGMTSNDALAIQNYLLGKMTSLPER